MFLNVRAVLAPDREGNSLSVDTVILDRVNHAVSILEQIRDSQATTHSAFQAPGYLQSVTGPQQDASTRDFGTQPAPTSQSAFTDDGFGRLEVSEVAARTNACEAILRWPVIAAVSQTPNIISFPLQGIGEALDAGIPAPAQRPSKRQSRKTAAIVDEDIYPLCKKFLALIHVKNPVLHVKEFMHSARSVSESSPTWDGQGCLVLLACALASVAAPYRSTEGANSSSSQQHFPDGSPTSTEDVDAGEAFFTAAQRRLGLLETSLLSVQCLYFAGLYEKFMIRPFSAWKIFQRACIELQVYLSAVVLVRDANEHVGRSRHIEQRLYWSCVRAESELRAELQLPTSGLQFKYPDLFPYLSLPDGSEQRLEVPPTQFEMAYESPCGPATHPSPLSTTSLEPEEQRSWLLYLAEISLRKIMNSTLEMLYANGQQFWVANSYQVLHRGSVLKEELLGWRAHLPDALKFSDQEVPDTEYSLFLKTRYLTCWEWIHRPFLYLMLHQQDILPGDQEARVFLPLAKECLHTCAELITLVTKHHRHGGVWGLLRKCFGSALMLIAAAHSEALELQAQKVHALVQLTRDTIVRWNIDSKDLVAMAQSLTKVAADFGLPID